MTVISGAFTYLMKGGFMMYPLLLSALLALTIIIERTYLLNKRYGTPHKLVIDVLDLVAEGSLGDAEKACLNFGTPAANILAAGIQNFSAPLEDMELSMKNQAERWVPLMEKRLEVLDTIITAAPLMGLLGTITGMMASFGVMTEKGINEPNAITGGVSEALLATATGLVIALVSIVAYNYLTTVVKNRIYDAESIALQLMEVRKKMKNKAKGHAGSTEKD